VTAVDEGESVSGEQDPQESLLEEIRLLRDAIDHAPIVVWSLDRDGKFLHSVGRGLELLGLQPGEVVGRSVWELYGEYEDILDATRRALSGSHVACTFDLGFVQFDAHYTPRFDDAGACIGATGVAVDVTSRHRAELTNRRLLAAIEQATESVALTDVEGVVTYVNPAYERCTGRSKKDVMGRPWAELEIRDDESFVSEVHKVLRSGVTWQGRIQSVRASGELFDEDATVSPILGRHGERVGCVAVKRDVTEQLRWEDQIRQSQKMEAVGQLAGGIAHDFNNLLQVIRGNVELMDQEEVSGELGATVHEIKIAAERATNLVRQLLAFSRKESVEFSVLQLNHVIENLLEMIERLLGEQIVVDWKPSPEPLYVRANPTQLEQVIVNLCVNARDAMPRGGRLRISIQRQTHPIAALQHEVEPRPYVVLTVEDNGEGMTFDVRRRIFEPFFTTKDISKGTGLGLATVYAIIERHGGFVDVTSEVGRGTVFRLYYPEVDALHHAPVRGGRRTHIEGYQRKVLVAEDDPQIRNVVTRYLHRAGFLVMTASDGVEADQICAQYAGDLALVVLDAIMPHRTGHDVFLAMRARGQMTPVLFVTGYGFESLDPLPEDERCLILPKPFDGPALYDSVARLLEGPKTIS
jgi:PAS domain S-box-containing protein